MLDKLLKLAVPVLILALIAITASFAAAFSSTWRQFKTLESREQQTAENLRLAEQQLSLRKQHYRLLMEDPEYIEHVVREKLNYAKPDEKIFRFGRKR